MQTNPYDRYKSVKVETASSKGLVSIAYDGIIDCLRKARIALGKKPRDIEAATNEIVRAQRIVGVLIEGLDSNIGEVAEMLGGFYAFLRKSLIQLNFNKNLDELDKIVKLITEVKGFWKQSSQESEEINNTVL